MWLWLSKAFAWAAFKFLDASVVMYIRSEGGSEALAKKLQRVAGKAEVNLNDTLPQQRDTGSLN